MSKLLFAVALALSSLLGVGPTMAETYPISSGVWGHYQEYLRTIGSTKPGAFAVTVDGYSSFYSYCPGIQCMPGTTFRHDAVQLCEREYGRDCVAFADRDNILIAYTVVSEPETSTSAAPVALEPAPLTRITLSSLAQAELNKYLNNVKSAGRAWTLAVAKDGSDAASWSCSTNGGGGYRGGSNGCDVNQGTPQESANRKAINNCGGPDECVLLYVGSQKVASIDIAGQ